MSRRGWALFVLLGVVWGLPYLLIRISVREISPALLVFVRTAGGAVLLFPLVAGRGTLRPVLRRWRAVLLYTVVEIGVPWYLLFNAERHLTSALAGLLVAAVPLVGALLALATRSDRLDGTRALGLLLGLAGVAALVGFDVHGSSLLAALSLTGVAVGYALGPWLLSRRLSDLPGVGVITVSLGMCALLYAPAAALDLPRHQLSASVVASMVALTVVCTAVAFVAFFTLVGEIGPMRTTVVTYLNPAVAVVLGVSVLGEPFGLSTGMGFALILAGSFLATRPLRHPADARPPGGPGQERSATAFTRSRVVRMSRSFRRSRRIPPSGRQILVKRLSPRSKDSVTSVPPSGAARNS